MQVSGPEIWTQNVILTQTIASSLGVLFPASAPNTLPRLGVDYIPPLNAKSLVKAPVRTEPENIQILQSTPYRSFEELPTEFSWNNLELLIREKNWALPRVPILDPPKQYGCGACWAFAIVGALSDRYAIAMGGEKNPDLSVTFLLSCMGTEERCNGGFPSDGGIFLETVGTIKDKCLDYSWCTQNEGCVRGTTGSSDDDLSALVPACHSNLSGYKCGNNNQVYRASRGSTKALFDVRSIKLDIIHYGPVCAVCRIYGDFIAGTMDRTVFPKADRFSKTNGVYIHVTGKDVYGYGKMNCLGSEVQASECYMGNHAMVIVGWGMENNVPGWGQVPYWVVRNSWGNEWNEGGYIKIAISDPDTNVNMELGLDRPLKIGNKYFGGVTTILPDIEYDKSNQSGTLRTKSPVRIRSVTIVNEKESDTIKIILFVFFFICVALLIIYLQGKKG